MASPSAEFTALRILDVLRGGTGNNVAGSQSLERIDGTTRLVAATLTRLIGA